MSRTMACFAVCMILISGAASFAGDADAVARGKSALESRAFTPAYWTQKAYDDAWEHWTPKPAAKPADYDKAFAAYYGLHPAPYKNDGYPMGLRKGPQGKGLVIDCMVCHGGSILGKSHLGLGNASLELQALLEDLSAASGKPGKLPHKVTNVRGTNEAFAMTEFLLAFRNADMSLRAKPFPAELRDQVCEDVPAWWLLKKKRTMYHTGSTGARSVRALMQFMLDPGNPREMLDKEEAVFQDIQAYLLSLTPPKFPDRVDGKLVAKGKELFTENCARCHGNYGPRGDYPNKIVKLAEVGTDPLRVNGLSPWYYQFYNESWFAKEKPTGVKAAKNDGYQAPPLDGVWASAPYFHNGAVPTLYDVLNSSTRPNLFTRSFATDKDAYDMDKLGWKVKELRETPKGLPPIEQRRIYDTTQPGRGNGGHTFGDDFTDDERRAVLEYLKTL
jgi:hypothetical protein